MRPSISTGQLRTDYSHTHRHYRSTDYWGDQEDHGDSRNDRAAYDPSLPSIPPGDESTSVSSCGRRQDAVEIFEEYGISRPGGWLSEDASSLDGHRPSSRLKMLPICHSCRERLASQRLCNTCGHESCLKCTVDLPSDANEDHAAGTSSGRSKHPQPEIGTRQSGHLHRTRITEYETRHFHDHSRSDTGAATPKPDPPASPERFGDSKQKSNTEHALSEEAQVPTERISSSLRNNPFLMADRSAKAQAAQPQTMGTNARARPPTRLSDCVPSRRASLTFGLTGHPRCSNPSCTADRSGHHHVGGCQKRATHHDTAQQKEEVSLEIEDREMMHDHPPLNSLQKRIDQLYRHAEDLNHSQHIMEHLAVGSITLDQGTVVRRRLANKSTDNISPASESVKEPFRMHSLKKDDQTAVSRAEGNHEHELIKDIRTAAPSPQLHLVGRDIKTPTPSPRLHSLTADEKAQLAQSTQAHDLVNDRVTSRELSPKSREISEEVFSRVAG